MKQKPWYADGLRFSCQRCSACCRYEPGIVVLSKEDLTRLALKTGLSETEFVKTYCRLVWTSNRGNVLSLTERANYDCVFWQAGGEANGGCAVYDARPRQCVTWPFWPRNLESKEAWEEAAEECPGMNQGQLHSFEEIQRIQ
jgi:Fe-S-cluster containining protein